MINDQKTRETKGLRFRLLFQILVASVQSLNEHLFGVKQRWVKPYLLLAVGVQLVPVMPPELLLS